ncbi:MAG: N-acetylneuraminate synthase family protein [Propionibacteriaceae bacterium]|nr:N-acetylneuraminate synthase family protein [Propionibacteriaceae bacterium]
MASTGRGSDQAASVEPAGLTRLVRDIRVIEQALGDGVKQVYPGELAAMPWRVAGTVEATGGSGRVTASALVESPVQLLHVIEWCHATASAERTTVAVLALVDETSRGQMLLRSMLYAGEEGSRPAGTSLRCLGSLLGTIGTLRRRVAAADQLVIGDPAFRAGTAVAAGRPG